MLAVIAYGMNEVYKRVCALTNMRGEPWGSVCSGGLLKNPAGASTCWDTAIRGLQILHPLKWYFPVGHFLTPDELKGPIRDASSPGNAIRRMIKISDSFRHTVSEIDINRPHLTQPKFDHAPGVF